MNPSYSLREVSTADLPEVLALNNASTPMVNEISLEELQQLSDMACYFKIAINAHQEIIGTLLVLPHQTAYKSMNYQWFNSRYEDFCYIDRIFIRSDSHGLGIGKSFYQDLLAHQCIDDEIVYLCCEVNTKPMNEPSLIFHNKAGFSEVGKRDSDDNKQVVMLLKKLSPMA